MLLEEAVEFVEHLDSLASERDLNHGLRRVLGLWGIEHFCFASLPRPDQDLHDVVLTQYVPQEWLDHYDEQNYLHLDAAIRFSTQTFYPFNYTDAPDPSRKAAKLISEMKEFGLARAVMIPVGGPAGTKGFAWLQGKNLDLNARAFLHTVVLYAYERLAAVTKGAPSVLLTTREKEVLSWSAAGKSAWETGEILHITQRTVEEHIASAMRKLGAGNRVHAVAIALRDRIISL